METLEAIGSAKFTFKRSNKVKGKQMTQKQNKKSVSLNKIPPWILLIYFVGLPTLDSIFSAIKSPIKKILMLIRKRISWIFQKLPYFWDTLYTKIFLDDFDFLFSCAPFIEFIHWDHRDSKSIILSWHPSNFRPVLLLWVEFHYFIGFIRCWTKG